MNYKVNGTVDATAFTQNGSPIGGEEVISYVGTPVFPEGLTIQEWSLLKVIKVGSVLWIVASATVKNETSASVTGNGIMTFTLPSEISAKLYRQDGTSCNNSYTSSQNIVSEMGVLDTQQKVYKLISRSANNFRLETSSNTTFDSGYTKYLGVRIPIFLDIGE